MASTKERCKYWDKCYQKDPAHKKRFLHPADIKGAAAKADKTAGDGGLEDISGTKVVFTGALTKQTRREAAAESELYGVLPMAALSKQTDILVSGTGGGQKLERAKSLGVTIMTEAEWNDMLAGAKKTVIKPKSKLIPADDSDDDDDDDDVDDDSGAAPAKAAKTAGDGGLEDISGTKVVFTGALAKQTRREAAAESELYGVMPMAALSKKTDILVSGTGGGQKLERAKSLGVTIMTEAEWENMLANAKKIDTKPKAGQKRAANHGISDSETEEEDDSTPAKKAKKADDSDDASAATPGKGTRPKCRYWDKCYRKDPAHKKAFRHPGDKGGGKGNGDEEDMDDEPAPPQPKNVMADGAEVNIDNHRIKRIGDHYSCNCAGWKFQQAAINKRSCRHLKAHLGLEYEAHRVGETLTASGRVSRPPVQLKHKNIGQLLLAHKWTESVNPKGWWISEKLDGVRAFWDGRTFYSRLGNEFRAPKWFTKDFPTDMTLDGELFGGRGKFQGTVSIVKTPESDQWKNIKYYVFDAPSVKAPFEKRIETVNEFFDETKVASVHVVEQEVCRDVPHLKKELARVEGLGGEGLMIRKPKSQYEHGRSHSLLKIKTFHDAEAEVTGHEKGKGRNSNVCGALVCKMECGKVFRVGSGLSDADRRKPPKIGTIITYKFQELTNSGVPRFPSYIGIRADADGPKDAVLPKKPTDD